MRTLNTIFNMAAVSVALLASGASYAQGKCSSVTTPVFDVRFLRLGQDSVEDHGEKVARVFGDLIVDGRTVGRFYDNPAKMISPGKYRGLLRYQSGKEFVQSKCGAIGTTGDFLLEIANVTGDDGKPREAILVHPGRRPSHSKGCILIPREFDANGKPLPLSDSNPLRKLRAEFYGTDDPVQCPNKTIVVTVEG